MRRVTKEIFTCSGNEAFIEAACKLKLEFLIVGGAAIAYYGCRELEDVDDLDLMINPTLKNAEILINLFKAKQVPFNWPIENITRLNVVIPVKDTYYFDILTPPKAEINFNELLGRSNNSLIGFSTVKVISLKDLIEITNEALDIETKAVELQKEKIEKLSKDLSNLKSA